MLNLVYLVGIDTLFLGSGVGIWRFATDLAQYYIVDDEFVKGEPALRKVAKFLEEAPISKEELTRALTDKLDKEGGEFLKKIYQDVSDKYSEEYQTILKAEMKKRWRTTIRTCSSRRSRRATSCLAS